MGECLRLGARRRRRAPRGLGSLLLLRGGPEHLGRVGRARPRVDAVLRHQIFERRVRLLQHLVAARLPGPAGPGAPRPLVAPRVGHLGRLRRALPARVVRVRGHGADVALGPAEGRAAAPRRPAPGLRPRGVAELVEVLLVLAPRRRRGGLARRARERPALGLPVDAPRGPVRRRERRRRPAPLRRDAAPALDAAPRRRRRAAREQEAPVVVVVVVVVVGRGGRGGRGARALDARRRRRRALAPHLGDGRRRRGQRPRVEPVAHELDLAPVQVLGVLLQRPFPRADGLVVRDPAGTRRHGLGSAPGLPGALATPAFGQHRWTAHE